MEMLDDIFTDLTLKQTHNEKGRVTMTSSHEIPVRRSPQIPIPFDSGSSAIKNKNQLLLFRK